MKNVCVEFRFKLEIPESDIDLINDIGISEYLDMKGIKITDFEIWGAE
jgi:hypothetical protein